MAHALSEEIHAIVRRRIEAGEIAGGITLVAQNGQVLAVDAQGVDDPASARPLRTDSVFSLFSLTKPITAAAAMALIAAGKLSPDDEVAQYIPEFSKPRMVRTLKPGSAHRPMKRSAGSPFPELDLSYPAPEFDYAPLARPLTVHDFLSFTSGLQTIGVPNEALPPILPDDTTASFVAKLGEVPLEFQPGAQWHYSNATGYEVLARIIEVVSGAGFAEFVQATIFDPLEMRDACFGEQERIKDRVINSGPLGQGITASKTFASGSAGAYATIEDYWRFGQMLLDDGVFRGRRVLPADAVRRMRTHRIGEAAFPGFRVVEYSAAAGAPNRGLSYGYGVGVVTDGPASGLALPTRSFGWDGVGTRRFWGIPALNAVLLMFMPGLGPPADATHKEIEALVCTRLA